MQIELTQPEDVIITVKGTDIKIAIETDFARIAIKLRHPETGWDFIEVIPIPQDGDEEDEENIKELPRCESIIVASKKRKKRCKRNAGHPGLHKNGSLLWSELSK